MHCTLHKPGRKIRMNRKLYQTAASQPSNQRDFFFQNVGPRGISREKKLQGLVKVTPVHAMKFPVIDLLSPSMRPDLGNFY